MRIKYQSWYVLIIGFLFFWGIWPSTARGKDLRVPQEYSHIQQAVDQARPKDRILVAEGVYLERVKLTPGIIPKLFCLSSLTNEDTFTSSA